VNRQIFFIVFFGVVLAGAFALFTLPRPGPQPVQPPAAVEPSAPRPAGDARAEAGAPPSQPAPRIARREPAAAPAPKPAPPPAPDPVPAPPATGTLSIDSDVPGAQVFIDRVFIGATPVIAPNVKPGTHRLNVSARRRRRRNVRRRSGTARHPDQAEGRSPRCHNRGPPSAPMGSCRGQLIATPQGLRYETADKDDGFSVPLQDLEAFQVDYLAKQLKLKLQKGKQYEFSDPDGNADRLFVFHRDVEKARERLRKGDPPASR
jgi:hypothetical protein